MEQCYCFMWWLVCCRITAVCGAYYIGGREFDSLSDLIGYYTSYSDLLKGERLQTPVPPPEVCVPLVFSEHDVFILLKNFTFIQLLWMILILLSYFCSLWKILDIIEIVCFSQWHFYRNVMWLCQCYFSVSCCVFMHLAFHSIYPLKVVVCRL